MNYYGDEGKWSTPDLIRRMTGLQPQAAWQLFIDHYELSDTIPELQAEGDAFFDDIPAQSFGAHARCDQPAAVPFPRITSTIGIDHQQFTTWSGKDNVRLRRFPSFRVLAHRRGRFAGQAASRNLRNRSRSARHFDQRDVGFGRQRERLSRWRGSRCARGRHTQQSSTRVSRRRIHRRNARRSPHQRSFDIVSSILLLLEIENSSLIGRHDIHQSVAIHVSNFELRPDTALVIDFVAFPLRSPTFAL